MRRMMMLPAALATGLCLAGEAVVQNGVAVSEGLCAASNEPYLAENLPVWFRADIGVSTNAAGGVTAWKNQGTLGAAIDMAPMADNSAAGIAYEEKGINGQPTISFDGSTCLQAAEASDFGVTSAGGAWIVVYRTSQTADERKVGNRAIFGCAPSNDQRIGAFFPVGSTMVRCLFYNNKSYINMPVSADDTQVLAMMNWQENGVGRSYATTNATVQARAEKTETTDPTASPGSAKLGVGGQMLSWMGNFIGEIAELRIYNRPLTRREFARVQFELFARYGVFASSHGRIDNTALPWYETSDQFGYMSGWGLLSEMRLSASSGGATITLENGVAGNWEGFIANNGYYGPGRSWYISAYDSVRSASSATFTFDPSFVHIGENPSLWCRLSHSYAWTKVDATATKTEDGKISFIVPAGKWLTGFYSVRGELDGKLAVWHRADMYVSTNAAGGVTQWRNLGTVGRAADVLPAADNSAAHVAYVPEWMNGKPAISFDGVTYLQSVDVSDFGVATGGAWFVVFKTDLSGGDRKNKSIFGCSPNSGNNRFGVFFTADTLKARGYFFTTNYQDASVTENAVHVLSLMQWPEADTYYNYIMSDATLAARSVGAPSPGSVKFNIGGPIVSWMSNFVGEIAELRIYNSPLTGRERMAVQFELFARYGLSYSVIDGEGLSWHENGAQFGYWATDGLPETVPVSAASGGATIAFDEAPATTSYTRSYFANNGMSGFDRVWYLFISAAARALPMTFSVDSSIVEGEGRLILRHSESSCGPWKRVGACDTVIGGEYRFTFEANGLKSGFYRVERAKGTKIIVW